MTLTWSTLTWHDNGHIVALMVSFFFVHVARDNYLHLISGHCVAQLHLVFLIPGFNFGHSLTQFLSYIHHFNIIPPNSPAPGINQCDPYSRLYTLWHALHSDKLYLGDIIPLSHMHSLVQLVPHFGSKADVQLTFQKSLECSTEFWLNHYETEEMY